jgi:hypothetical protein
MKKKKKTVKKAVVAAAVVPAALDTRRKKNTASASDLLSNLGEESPRKPPPEDMPSYVPHSKRNPPRSTRAAAPQPPTLVYLPLLTEPPDDDDCNPLDHNSPHKEPSVEFVEKAARAAHPSDAMDEEDDDDDADEAFRDLVGAKTSGLDDLAYSSDDDDEDYDDGMEEEARAIEYSTSRTFRPGHRHLANLIPGGPLPPSYDGMSKTEVAFAKSEFKKKRKKYTDALRVKRLKENNDDYEQESFSGCLTTVLRPMTDVQNVRLEVNHNFPDKEMLLMRVAEEANLRGVNVYCARSDLRDYVCTGSKFCVRASHTEQNGWMVSVASVRESDEFGPAAQHHTCDTGGTEKLSSPFRTRWIVPIILPIIFESPAICNKNLRAALSLYGKEHALTDSILQDARSHAKAHLFGVAEENVKFAEGMKSELEKEGHVVELVYTSRKETLKNVERLVVGEELIRLKKATNGTLDREERRQFWNQWKLDNYALLVNQLGFKTQQSRFFHGVFFTPSFTKRTVPELQTLFMADACHLNFGKYTMFACYGVTANANMSPVGFAIIFGNENGTSWKQFWDFIYITHPTMNRPDVTIVTDQDKGSEGAISAVMNDCGHFFCAWHRKENIIKQCGGSSGKVPYSALWVYNRLKECRSVDHFNKLRTRYFSHMSKNDLQYLNNIPDTAQYPVKRCEQGAYMYHRTTSQGSEVMNAANWEMRSRRAVCPVNACLLLMRAECRRYASQKKNAWAQATYLTPRGDKEYQEVFDGLNYREFSIIVVERDESWECIVKRMHTTLAQKHTVSIPKEPTRGSFFGECTCGLVRRDARPCEHMAAVVCSSRIAGLTRLNIMPFWWTRKQWQEQLRQEVTSLSYANMEVIRSNYKADDFMRYCPSWSAPNKPGRPSKGKRKLSALEIAQGKKKKTKPLTMFCQICRGVSHQTIDCWYQEKNSHRRPMTWTMEQMAIEKAMIESADPLPIRAGQQWQGSMDVDEEGCEEDVETGTVEGTEGTAD